MSARPTQPAGFGAFCATLAALLLALLCLFAPAQRGDAGEYAITAFALGAHATPDLRASDIAEARARMPARAPLFDALAPSVAAAGAPVYPAFARGADGKLYAVHFFGYSLLAALPVKLFALAGLAPLKGFQLLNLAMVFVLGVALWRSFGSAPRAFAGLALFMLSGGALYWTWISPECLCAAALLAGLLFYTSGAALAGALLAGLAAQQNPSILCFFAFAPLLQWLCDRHGAGARARAFAPRTLAALAAGVALALLPVAFNLAQFGVPSLLGARFSSRTMVSGARALSLFFDLNQGMLVGAPAVIAAFVLWGWRRPARRTAALAAACLVLTLALALPALTVRNWNSDAAGVMRYAFWAAMPLLFALLLRVRARPAWPRALVAAVLLGQAAAMINASTYSYVEFSPLAKLAMRHAPTHYHPEPEIFAERASHKDDYLVDGKVYTYRADGRRVTTLTKAGDAVAGALLCGGAGAPPVARDAVASGRDGWHYLHGELLCPGGGGGGHGLDNAGGSERLAFGLDDFGANGDGVLASGWNPGEAGGNDWDGAWSHGAVSQIKVNLPAGWRPATVQLTVHYLAPNARTRVGVNNVDLGWQVLDAGTPIALPAAALGDGAVLNITLTHELATGPREIALFLHSVTLR